MFNQIDDVHLKFKHPFTLTIAGPTGSGKTVLIRNILENCDKLIDVQKKFRVFWSYGTFQDGYNQPYKNPNIDMNYVEGLPTKDEGEYDILVVDDLMSEAGGSKALSNFFTRGSHHDKISVIFIVQNFFHKGVEMRTISLNSQYLILQKNRRDQSQMATLGRQLYPRNTNYFLDAYDKAINMSAYGYLVFDCRADTPEQLRLRTNILPQEFPIIVFIPKNV
jgi:ABC-type dipeptide/oligopeptide/nickel transport system ATPase component